VAAEIAEWLPDLVRVEVRPASDHAALHEAQVHGALAALLQLLLVEPVVATTASSEPTGSVVTFPLPGRSRSGRGWRGRARQWRRRAGQVARRGAELGLGRLLYALPVDRATKQRISSIAYLRAGLLITPRARRRRRVR
jgi:hypothetical protein